MMLLLTVWFVVRGLDCSFMENFSTIYIGYSVSWAGAVVGALWGFVDGLIGGLAFAWLYNKLAGAQ
jgi:hypothetical protein